MKENEFYYDLRLILSEPALAAEVHNAIFAASFSLYHRSQKN